MMSYNIINRLLKFKRDLIKNYIIPDLANWMILDNGTNGKIRLFEGPQCSAYSTILEPVIDNVHINTFDTKSWMFQ